eukprot:1087039-Pleurochrysis_carterae.AAC.2
MQRWWPSARRRPTDESEVDLHAKQNSMPADSFNPCPANSMTRCAIETFVCCVRRTAFWIPRGLAHGRGVCFLIVFRTRSMSAKSMSGAAPSSLVCCCCCWVFLSAAANVNELAEAEDEAGASEQDALAVLAVAALPPACAGVRAKLKTS